MVDDCSAAMHACVAVDDCEAATHACFDGGWLMIAQQQHMLVLGF